MMGKNFPYRSFLLRQNPKMHGLGIQFQHLCKKSKKMVILVWNLQGLLDIMAQTLRL
jgi:hypothetical protein